jgi:hypothetical protein
MAYMFAMPTTGLRWLTWLLVAWSTLQGVGWLTGVLPRRADLGSPAVSGATAACPRQDVSVSLTLAVMNFGMAYMFVAMAVRMSAMGGMHGM